jgi:hypothetical protein
MRFDLTIRTTRRGYSIDVADPANDELIYATDAYDTPSSAALDLADWFKALEEAEASYSHGEPVQ